MFTSLCLRDASFFWGTRLVGRVRIFGDEPKNGLEPKNGQNGRFGQKWPKMTQNGPKMVQNRANLRTFAQKSENARFSVAFEGRQDFKKGVAPLFFGPLQIKLRNFSGKIPDFGAPQNRQKWPKMAKNDDF